MPNFAAKITPPLLALLFLLLPVAVGAADRAALATGAMANFVFADPPAPLPAIEFVDGEGRALTLADFKGKTVLLNLWATWCGPCRHEMPSLDKLQAKLGSDRFEVVALSGDRQGPSVVPPFYKETGVQHLAVYNDRAMKAMRSVRALGLPTTLLIDAAGREVGRLVGPADWASPEAEALVRSVLDETGG